MTTRLSIPIIQTFVSLEDTPRTPPDLLYSHNPLMTTDETPTERPDTRSDLLLAAERLFAERGFKGASLRAITQEAGANLASVNYHFGSKEGLIREVFSHRIAPLNRERLKLLERCLEDASEPRLECIVRAFVAPAVRMVRRPGPGGSDFIRMMARAAFEGSDFNKQIYVDQFLEVFERFRDAFAEALPHLDRRRLQWRFHFMIGSMVHAAGGGFIASDVTGSLGPAVQTEELIEELVTFMAAGLPATRVTQGEQDS